MPECYFSNDLESRLKVPDSSTITYSQQQGDLQTMLKIFTEIQQRILLTKLKTFTERLSPWPALKMWEQVWMFIISVFTESKIPCKEDREAGTAGFFIHMPQGGLDEAGSLAINTKHTPVACCENPLLSSHIRQCSLHHFCVFMSGFFYHNSLLSV